MGRSVPFLPRWISTSSGTSQMDILIMIPIIFGMTRVSMSFMAEDNLRHVELVFSLQYHLPLGEDIEPHYLRHKHSTEEEGWLPTQVENDTRVLQPQQGTRERTRTDQSIAEGIIQESLRFSEIRNWHNISRYSYMSPLGR